MRLAQAAGADQDQGACLLDEGTVEEADHHRPLEFGPQAEVELLQGGGEGKAGYLELAADLVLLAAEQFFAEHLLQELPVAELVLLGVVNPGRIHRPDAAELEVGEFLLQAGAHAPPPSTAAARSRLATYTS